MKIQTHSEQEYVFRYVQLLQGLYKLTPRETSVAAAIVYRYLVLSKVKEKFSSKKKRDEYNPMAELKKPEVLKIITADLDMSFSVFRTYIKILKQKGFFVDGAINSQFIPTKNTTSIEIWI